MELFEARIVTLEQKAREHDARFTRLEASIDTLKEDVAEIKGSLKALATKSDLSVMVNGVLRDALNAVPMRQSILWTAISALAGAATVGITILSLHH